MKARPFLPALAFACAWSAAAAAPAAPPDPFHLKPGAKGRLCLDCHSEFEGTLKLPFVHTPVKSGNCVDCHSPHASSHGKLLAADPGAICARCHAGLPPAGAKSAHAPAATGQCVRCHDPHGARNRGNLKTAGNGLCAGCHADVAGAVAKARFQHPPALRSCLACHDPHASAKAGFLLKKEVPALCTDCHRADQPVFAKQHMSYPVGQARCTSCHDPHGSDNGGLLWATVHPPVANKMCGQCHPEPTSPRPLEPKRQGLDLCRGCHSEVANEILSRNRVHWPVLDATGCRNCHTPHAAPRKALLKDEAKTLCGSCHADTIARQEKSQAKHPPVEEGSCAACHSPHASQTVFLLRSPGVIELCGTCHAWQEHSSHPIGPKVADPRNKNLTLDCLSCHRSHGTPYKSLASFDTAAELCVQCHREIRR